MEKMLKATLFTLLISFLAIASSQAQNCTDYLIYRNPVAPFKLNSQTKSASCQAGRTYKLVLTLSKDKDYRVSFYASAVFDNNIQFKIIDKTGGKTVVDLPGESEDNAKGTAVLRPYIKDDKMVHPYYDIIPENETVLEIIIDVKKVEGTDPDEISRGCVGVYVLDKKRDGLNDGFKTQK